MAQIIMYTKSICPYCVRAKNLLQMKGITEFEEINIENDNALREEMIAKSNGRMTVPQIFINDRHVGGFDDLDILNKQGELNSLLAGD